MYSVVCAEFLCLSKAMGEMRPSVCGRGERSNSDIWLAVHSQRVISIRVSDHWDYLDRDRDGHSQRRAKDYGHL